MASTTLALEQRIGAGKTGELELREKKSNTRGESRWGSLLTEMIGAFPCIAMGDY